MELLQEMNQVVAYIEDNLTEQIRYEALARMAGCSVYEFSRIFSFLTGMSLSEYIRRRRLSQARRYPFQCPENVCLTEDLSANHFSTNSQRSDRYGISNREKGKFSNHGPVRV